MCRIGIFLPLCFAFLLSFCRLKNIFAKNIIRNYSFFCIYFILSSIYIWYLIINSALYKKFQKENYYKDFLFSVNKTVFYLRDK